MLISPPPEHEWPRALRRSARALRAARGDAAALLALAALAVAPWAPAIVRGALPAFMDVLTQFYPWRRMTGEFLCSGLAPFWNPASFGGAPLLANPQLGALYPGHWPFFALPGPGMWTLTAAAHVALAACGMSGLLRWAGCRAAAALAGALALAWGGWAWAHYAFGSYHQVWAWWPWQAWLLLAWVERGGRRWAAAGAGLGALGALQALAGAPQMAWLGALGALALAAAAWAAGPREGGRAPAAARLAAGFALAGALALASAAPQILASRALMRETLRSRGPLPIETLREGALGPDGLARALLGGTGWPEDAESAAYVGLAALLLAGGAFFARDPRRRRTALALAAVVALGAALCLRWLAPLWSAALPGFSRMHDPRRAVALCGFALAAMAGLGLETLARDLPAQWRARAPRTRRVAAAVAGLAVLAALAACAAGLARAGVFVPTPEPPWPQLGWLRMPGKEFSLAARALLGAIATLAAAALVIWSGAGRGAGGEAGAGASAVRAAGQPISPGAVLHGGGAAGALSASRAEFRINIILCFYIIFLALDWFTFAGRRISLATIAPDSSGGLAPRVAEAADRLQSAFREFFPQEGVPARPGVSAEASAAATALPPARFFLYDSSGNYSYDFRSPGAGSALLPGLSPLAWRADAPGVSDLQGYDPALPRRLAALLGAANRDHAPFYPAHFLLARALAAPEMRRLGPYLVLGPADRYLLPLSPSSLRPGEIRRAAVEEPAEYEGLEIRVRAAETPREEIVLLMEMRPAGGVSSQKRLRIPPANLRPGAWALVAKFDAPGEFRAPGGALALYYEPPAPGAAAPPRIEAEISLTGGPRATLYKRVGAEPAAGADAPPALWRPLETRPWLELDPNPLFAPPSAAPEDVARLLRPHPDRVILEWPAEAPLPPSATLEAGKAESAGAARMLAWRPGRVEIEADVTAPGGAALVLREPYFHGWRATVDGAAAAIAPADVAFQAVWLAPGAHRVVWRYRPPGFFAGGALALAAWLAAAAAIFHERRRVAKQAPGAPPISPAELREGDKS